MSIIQLKEGSELQVVEYHPRAFSIVGGTGDGRILQLDVDNSTYPSIVGMENGNFNARMAEVTLSLFDSWDDEYCTLVANKIGYVFDDSKEKSFLNWDMLMGPKQKITSDIFDEIQEVLLRCSRALYLDSLREKGSPNGWVRNISELGFEHDAEVLHRVWEISRSNNYSLAEVVEGLMKHDDKVIPYTWNPIDVEKVDQDIGTVFWSAITLDRFGRSIDGIFENYLKVQRHRQLVGGNPTGIGVDENQNRRTAYVKKSDLRNALRFST